MVTVIDDAYMVILPETNGETEVVKHRIWASIAQRNKTNPLLDFAVTLAIGSVHWTSEYDQTMEQVLAEADRLICENKRKSQYSSP